MPTIDEQDKIAENGALIAEIMALAYWVNATTEYCVFAEYMGHVDHFSVDIARSKNNYQEKLASTEFYTAYAGDRPRTITNADILRAKRDHLKHILETEEIDPTGMDVVREVVETYQF